MTTLDRILGVTALACLIGFLAILGAFVKEPALITVLVIGVLMASYDFWLELFRKKADDRDDEES